MSPEQQHLIVTAVVAFAAFGLGTFLGTLDRGVNAIESREERTIRLKIIRARDLTWANWIDARVTDGANLDCTTCSVLSKEARAIADL